MTAECERPRLREYRPQLGWTQQELADRLAHLAWMVHREHVAVNADMVARWERGVKGVSPRYRELLCRLFGVTAEQLGLKTTPAGSGCWSWPIWPGRRRLVAVRPSGGDQLAYALLAATCSAEITTEHVYLALITPPDPPDEHPDDPSS